MAIFEAMKVCIAEKPSVAKELANIIGAKQRKDGYFEGNGYQVTWTFGHFCTLKEPRDYNPVLKSWNLHYLPIIPPKFGIKVIDDDGVKKQFKVIEYLISNATEVINCGDAGQEGELIQRWVLQKAKCQVPVKRLWISSLTEEAIRAGFKKLYDAKDFDSLYAAGSGRAIGDWLLGINATRLYTLKYSSGKNVLSIGRVQTPTLALIVNRHKEIENFISKPYWELKTTYRNVLFSAIEGKFEQKEKAEAIVEQIKSEEFEVTNFEKKRGKESAPKLFDLTSLQVDCNKKLNLSADETLKVAQRLYEKKVLTYPRVDTRFLPTDQYKAIPGILNALQDYRDLTAPLLAEPICKPKQVFNDKKITDHHAIIPTNVVASGLHPTEEAVYDMVVKRFLANFYPECTVSKTQVDGIVKETAFKATGKQIIDPGWRVVYGKEQAEDAKSKEEEQLLPEFQKGERGPHEPLLQEKQTRPPKPFTEATLLRAMETAGKQVDDDEMRELMKENGIGRPSTRAAIIETLFRRKYIQKNRKTLEPTITGIELVDTIQNDMLKSAEMTGKWEKQLRDVEKGEYQLAEFIENMKLMITQLTHEVKYAVNKRITIQDPELEKLKAQEAKAAEKKAKAAAKKEKEEAPITCPRCKKGTMLKGKTAFGCSEYKNGCKTLIPFEFLGKKLTDKQIEAVLRKGKSPVIKGFDLDGEKVEGHLELGDNIELKLVKKEKAPLTCPTCKQGTMLKGKAAYGCNRFREGCRFTIPFEFMGKKLTEKQIEALIYKGKTPTIKGFKTEQGEEVNGKLLVQNGKVVLE